MANKNFQKYLLDEMVKFFQPICDLNLTDPDDVFMFFDYCGWDLKTIFGTNNASFITQIGTIVTSVEHLVTYIGDGPETFDDFKNCLTEAAHIVTAIKGISLSTQLNAPAGWATDLPLDILSRLTTIYLLNRSRKTLSLFFVLTFIGAVDDESPWIDVTVNNKIVRRKNRMPNINFDKIGDFFSDPIGRLKELYKNPEPGGFSTPVSTAKIAKKLFGALQKMLLSPSFEIAVGRGPDAPEAVTDEEKILDGMAMITYPVANGSDGTYFSLYGIMGLLSEQEAGPGFYFLPSGELNFSDEFGDWTLTASIDTGNIPGFKITGDGLSIYDPGNAKTDIKLKVTVENNDEDGVAWQIGSTEGTHLKIGSVKFAGSLDVLDKTYIADISAAVQGVSFVLKGGDGDSFLSKILPENGITVDFDLLVGFNNQKGLYFGGSGGLQVDIPIHKKFLGIDFDSATLSIHVKEDGTIPISGAVSFAVNLGPLHLAVKNIGVQANLSFPDGGGNAGPMNLSLGFKSPTGVAIGIDANPVSGGGFLNFDETTATYTGGLELNFSKISFKAIGIISTKLPGGQKGYSLLIIITAEFTPIQLGMGFTLNGVGGILGLHRTMNPDFLRNGIRDNTLDSILFPKDIVKNANTIISNLGQAFPIQKDQFLIGPMAKIGWGTPTLLTIELGIIIEFPDPVRLAILGVVRAILPDPDKAVLKLQINFIGIIDFTNKYLSFDASLFDSKILTFGLFGDMALRLYWGDKPNFLMSVGGFHPKYTPPPLNLPQMRRLSIILADKENLKISVETYFAVTSNSVQFGARVDAMAKAWKIQAVGALWFDILFQFSPFYFIADMGVMFAIKMGSKEILSIYIDFSLEGPNPWRARGKGSFKILFVKVNVSFDKTFGEARTEVVAAVDVDPKLMDAIAHKDNWQVQLPDRSHQLVAYRELPQGDTSLQVDPGGALVFGQKVVPFNLEITKFGTGAVKDFKKYSIDTNNITSGGTALAATSTTDFFARNEFFYMKDEEKLSKDAYEKFENGVTIGGNGKLYAKYSVHKQCGYEEIFIDNGVREKKEQPRLLSATEFRQHQWSGYISKSRLSRFGNITTQNGPKATKLEESNYVFATKNDFEHAPAHPGFNTYTEAEKYLLDLQATSPATAETIMIANSFEL